MPQPILRGPDGRRKRLDDLLGTGFALVGAGVDPRATLDIQSLRLWQTLGARFVTVYPFGGRPNGAGVDRAAPHELLECEDPGGDFFRWWRTAGGRPGSVAIVRPDKFVFSLTSCDELLSATHEFARQMHCDKAASERVPMLIEAGDNRWREAA